MNKKQLIDKMKSCYQIKNKQTVLEHGISVLNYYNDLFSKKNIYHWKLPEWFIYNKKWIQNNLLPYNIIKEYTIMHDCGKPFCQTIDEFG